MAAIDTSIVNVSLPVIRNQFGVSLTSIAWVITAYMISFTLFIPMTNWLKKRIGYCHLFVYSVALFTLGSFLCGLSHSLTSLIFSRILQALGGGAISPTSLAILSENYPAEKRGNAIGWWGIGNVMGPTLGPTLGGLLTHYFGNPTSILAAVLHPRTPGTARHCRPLRRPLSLPPAFRRHSVLLRISLGLGRRQSLLRLVRISDHIHPA